MAATLTCPKCLTAVTPAVQASRQPEEQDCPSCRGKLTVETFPRLTSGAPDSATAHAGQRALDGDAVCQFYPELQAETVCEECGCFMSKKAAIEWSGRTLCMPCLHQLRETRGKDEFSARRSLPDNSALGMVVFLLPLSLFTGPMAIYHLIRHRKTPGSLIPRSRFRWWLALTIAIAVTAGWIFLIVLWIAMIVRAVTS